MVNRLYVVSTNNDDQHDYLIWVSMYYGYLLDWPDAEGNANDGEFIASVNKYGHVLQLYINTIQLTL